MTPECNHIWIGDTCDGCGVSWRIWAEDEIERRRMNEVELRARVIRAEQDALLHSMLRNDLRLALGVGLPERTRAGNEGLIDKLHERLKRKP